jgi:hypothetical protein
MDAMNILEMSLNASAMNVMRGLHAIIAERLLGVIAKSLTNIFMRRVYES